MVAIAAVIPSAKNAIVPTMPMVTSSNKYWLSKMRYFGRNVPSPLPNHGFCWMNSAAREKLSVREVMLGSSLAPVNKPTMELTKFGASTAMTRRPTTATPKTRILRAADHPIMQMTNAIKAPR